MMSAHRKPFPSLKYADVFKLTGDLRGFAEERTWSAGTLWASDQRQRTAHGYKRDAFACPFCPGLLKPRVNAAGEEVLVHVLAAVPCPTRSRLTEDGFMAAVRRNLKGVA